MRTGLRLSRIGRQPGSLSRASEVVAPRASGRTVLAVVTVLTLAAALLAWLVTARIRADLNDLDRLVPPVVQPISPSSVFLDDTPVELTITADTETIPFLTTRDAVRSDVTLWRRMDISDWSAVGLPLRAEGLDAMLDRFAPLVLDPGTWDRMDAVDWDPVPQPVRALAFRHMAEYWAGYYQVGSAHGLPRGLVADTLEAIVMSESWFDHRAVNRAAWGNRDIGVAQASDGARERLRELYDAGLVDAAFDDGDYFNPWVGTRFLAIWFDLLLQETDGDLDVAIRAYHRGTDRAFDELGDAYLEGVLRRRRRYIRNEGAPAAWDYLWTRDRELRDAAWPWFSRQPSPGLPTVAPATIPRKVAAWRSRRRAHFT